MNQSLLSEFGDPIARVEAALANWRAMRADLEEMTIRSALVVTELRVFERNTQNL